MLGSVRVEWAVAELRPATIFVGMLERGMGESRSGKP
jgi:hypothetical protein